MVILLAFKNKLDVYSIRSRGYDNLKVLSDDFSALLSRTVNSEATAKAVANYTENEKGLKMSLIIMATMIIVVVAVSLTVFFTAMLHGCGANTSYCDARFASSLFL